MKPEDKKTQQTTSETERGQEGEGARTKKPRTSNDKGVAVSLGELKIGESKFLYLDEQSFEYTPLKIVPLPDASSPTYHLKCQFIGCQVIAFGASPRQCELKGSHNHKSQDGF